MSDFYLNRNKRSNVKTVFKQHPLESILLGLWQFKDEISSIEKAYTTTIAIEFCEPGPYDNISKNIEKTTVLKLVNLATNYCLNYSESGDKFSKEKNDIFYNVFNLMANQLSVSDSSPGDYARALLMFEIIPNEIKKDKFKHCLAKAFLQDTGYSINEYIQVCFLAVSAITANGYFTDDYLEKATTVTQSPCFKTMNTILSDISASAIHYRRERKRLNSLNSFKYQPLLIYPLIKPWSQIPKHSKRKRYLSPLPDLIAHKANIGIYHHFLSKYKTKFTRFFGKEIFERYVSKALSNCCHGDIIIDESVIKAGNKIPQGVKIPDFLFIKDNKGIIIECKAAVLPLGVFTNGSMIDFKTTVNKIYKGVIQTANFEEHAINKSLYNVTEWIRLVITYEPLWGINSGILSETLITDFKDENEALNFKAEFDKVQILSISQLDNIQAHTSDTDSLFSILKRLKNSDFNDVIKDLISKTGRTFKDSYLAKYTEQLIDSLLPEMSTLNQSKVIKK